ncbi:hypothetical protein A2313_04075 [Candidatus Roizmanbacteria bacterium RIFOXYB2_FULL_41_10]|uniref:Glycosyltransferase 2-like domain-containing protein n=1 Tax=Candidatus Roizmanbacteria bacterium RIFOXYA1_FULL_41_12 TaxID=1802082 RepID=A0A1F7K9Q8_9BACT|nr:MAG: hypothetical protein A2209_03335 [Candidatus Roizmanbacteria bacterium RIFOXYA1_FULL_41_12]OGK66389.1 MAG: hypothetical protein A2377_03515 [Candidatus Roizmanbacteria bacterium RIFOXYB1_FULL_41_27]OGK71788.1 MAG: hypothetical protein A2313_04075 [Candidatus Roizmanbacteria bacterium RIFOXYB2_FULL_41_10]OGK72483.1 MAG: hypothetical protein A2403_04045 [Candidatus Roizmanbacteria bacterium RIFOXYC1_FULL_41_16]OGK75413.1 MAG: hypothetical protein A2459_01695 [Candidatus Roizmanbacteria ba
MKVSVVVPVYNEEAIIDKCLKAIFAQSEPADEVILVDNNCTDNSMKIAKKYPVRIIKEKQQGISYARNKGFDIAKYEIITRTDSDTIVPRHWLKNIRQVMKAHPQYLAAAGPISYYDLPFNSLASWYHQNLYYYVLRAIHGYHLLHGSNMVVRKSIWQKVKNKVNMDNSQVHEDIDLSIRIAKLGQIGYSRQLATKTSGRRSTKFVRNLEYPYRYFKMLTRLYILKNY